MNNFDPNFLSSIEDVIEDAKKGKMFILVDDEDRENEGDLCILAEFANADSINFMAKHGRGLICLALERTKVENLGLEMMQQRNPSRLGTAFTISIEASEGILEQLVISRFPLYLIILVKVFCYWVSVGLPLIIIFPVIALFLEININVIGTICISLIIGTISFSFVGILGAGLVLGAKKSNYIVMLLIIPLTIPILIFGISTTNFALNDLPTEATIYLQCMALSFLIAVVPVITSKAIKIYVE